jgi:hypothetical protein
LILPIGWIYSIAVDPQIWLMPHHSPNSCFLLLYAVVISSASEPFSPFMY